MTLKNSSDDRAIQFMRNTLYGIMATILLLIIWAFFAKIDNYAKTKGAVVPVGNIQSIQSLEGGRIDQILIHEGDLVQKGQTIIHFDPIHAKAENSRLLVKAIDYGLEAERLRAFVQEENPDFSKFTDKYPTLVAKHTIALEAEKAELGSELEVMQKELDTETAQLDKVKSELIPLRRQLRASRKILKMYEKMAKEKVGSKKELYDNQQKEALIAKEYHTLIGEKKVLQTQISRYGAKIDKVKKHYFSEALDRRTKVLSELSEARELLIDSEDKLDHRVVVSPVTGIIKSIPHTSIGTVISPGGVVAEIVPVGTDIVVEVKIEPKDIGFILHDQKTILRFDAYDFSQYGVVYGRVVSISPTTFMDKEHGTVYYKARVRPRKTFVGRDSLTNQIIPGMTVECDIITDRKTIFQALIKPVYNAMHTAFRGR